MGGLCCRLGALQSLWGLWGLVPPHAAEMALLLPPLTTAFRCQEQAQTTERRTTLKTIWKSICKIDASLNATLVSPGRRGRALPVEVQQLKSSPRYGYKPSPPNACVCPLFDVHLNLSISSLTKCWDHHTGAMRPEEKANTTVVRSSRIASPGSSEMGREHEDQLRCSGM